MAALAVTFLRRHLVARTRLHELEISIHRCVPTPVQHLDVVSSQFSGMHVRMLSVGQN